MHTYYYCQPFEHRQCCGSPGNQKKKYREYPAVHLRRYSIVSCKATKTREAGRVVGADDVDEHMVEQGIPIETNCATYHADKVHRQKTLENR